MALLRKPSAEKLATPEFKKYRKRAKRHDEDGSVQVFKGLSGSKDELNSGDLPNDPLMV